MQHFENLGIITLNAGFLSSENRCKVVIDVKPTEAQLAVVQDFFDLMSKSQKEVYIFANNCQQIYKFNQYTSDELIKKIRKAFAFGRLEEDLQEIDSAGNVLSQEQIEFFKNSKIRDRSGKLLVCYHGTNNPGFTEFNHDNNNSQFGNYKFGKYNVNFFATNKDVAKGYTNLGVERDNNIYACYLNVVNPYVVNNETEEDVDNFVTKRWNNIKDNNVRNRQVEKFKQFWNRYGNRTVRDLAAVNKDLAVFNAAVVSSLEREDDNSGYSQDEDYYDLVSLGDNTLFGSKHVLMYSYTLDDIFDEDNYEEIRDHLVGDIDSAENDYYLTTNDVIRYVLNMNEEEGTNYDGIIIPDIYDIGPTGSLLGDKTTDIITLNSSNQIKSIDNKTPTNSNNINEAYENDLDISNALEHKDEVLKQIVDRFGISGKPGTGGYYILPDGSCVQAKDHLDIDKFLISNGYIKKNSKYLDYHDGSQFLNAIGSIRIRRRGGSDSWLLPYLVLPKTRPTEAQYQTLLEWLDFVLAKSGIIMVELDDMTFNNSQRYTNITADEVIKKIKRYYTTGVLVEDLNNPDIGYHAGDLGKSEYYSDQSGDRGTGHFGTGTYFVGNPEKIKGYNRRDGQDAPQHQVDFSSYKLFKPQNFKMADDLHNALKILNDYSSYFNPTNIEIKEMLKVYNELKKYCSIDGGRYSGYKVSLMYS